MFLKLLHEDKKHVKSYSPFLPPSVRCFFFLFTVILKKISLHFSHHLWKCTLQSNAKNSFQTNWFICISWERALVWLWFAALDVTPRKQRQWRVVRCQPVCWALCRHSVLVCPPSWQGQLVKVGRGKCGEPSWKHGLLPDTAWLSDCGVLLIILGLQITQLSKRNRLYSQNMLFPHSGDGKKWLASLTTLKHSCGG